MGRIGKKETKTLKNGNELTVLSIATTRKWNNSEGQLQEETTWHTVQCFNKLGEIAKKYAQVGHLIYIEGEINNRKQESGNGEVKYFYSINCNELKLIPGQKKRDENEKPNLKQNEIDSELDDPIPF